MVVRPRPTRVPLPVFDQVSTVLRLGALVGCGRDQSTSSADCAAAIRKDAVTFVEAGFTSRPGINSGHAERAECHDVGRDAPGTVFPPDATNVDVVAFEGHDLGQVLGVREGTQTRVFIVEGVETEPVMNSLKIGANE